MSEVAIIIFLKDASDRKAVLGDADYLGKRVRELLDSYELACFKPHWDGYVVKFKDELKHGGN